MRLWILIPVLALTMLTLSAAAQQSIFSRGPQLAAGAGSIQGVVVNANTGQPIAGAKVSLSGGIVNPPPVSAAAASTVPPVGANPGSPAVPTTVPPSPSLILSLAGNNTKSSVTGPDGRFSFTGLNGGSYTLLVAAAGFAQQEYGSVGSRVQGQALTLNAAQPLRDLSIRLAANGSIGGRIVDENRKPATNASIYILQTGYSDQGQTLASVAEGTVDDRGDFRIFDVPPGRYFVLAGSSPRILPPVLSGGRRVPAPRFALQYYPNSPDLSQAVSVEVNSSAEMLIDMRLVRQEQTFHVRGRVVNDSGVMPPNVMVAMAYQFLSGGGSFNTGGSFDPATGVFDVPNVPPGDYSVQAKIGMRPPSPSEPLGAGAAGRPSDSPTQPFGQVPIRVVNADVDGVVIMMSNGVTARGRIVIEGQTAAVPTVQQMRLGLTPVSLINRIVGVSAPVSSPPAADGTFQISGLREGEYYVRFSPAGNQVKTIRFGGVDVLSAPLRFDGVLSGTFEVILRSSTARINGIVVDGQSRPVSNILVVAVPSQRTRTDLFRFAFTDADGRFAFMNIPVDDYRLFCWESISNGEYYNPAFIRRYETSGTAVHVAESSTQEVSVRLIQAP